MSLCQRPFNELRYKWPRPKKPDLFQRLYRIYIGPRDRRQEVLVTGKYKARANKFESGQFEFDLNTCEAWSYGWWQFVKRIGKTIYFNDYSYSSQTNVHQCMAENILLCEQAEEYGYKIKRVYIREGLNNLDRAISNMECEIKELREQIAKPRSQVKSNKRRERLIKELEAKIVKTKALELKLQGSK